MDKVANFLEEVRSPMCDSSSYRVPAKGKYTLTRTEAIACSTIVDVFDVSNVSWKATSVMNHCR